MSWKTIMSKEFSQIHWDAQLEDDCRQIVRLAVREDLDRGYDWTTLALAAAGAQGKAAVVARQAGVIAGTAAAGVALDEMDVHAAWRAQVEDGAAVDAGACIAHILGPARDILTSERLILNLIGRLSGVATLTRQYVNAVAGAKARIYDTRKTTPGWRRLEKYAVRCGGGFNHRTGLFDGLLIKDNHLALAAQTEGRMNVADAVIRVRQFISETMAGDPRADEMIVEVEVGSLEQLSQALSAQPDIVLLDNMAPEQLRHAVAQRDTANPHVQLEASGGIDLTTVRAVAETGVDRISVGALTHSAVSLDIGLDWL